MNGSPRKDGPIERPVNSFEFNPAIPALPNRKNRLELIEEWSIPQQVCMKITEISLALLANLISNLS